MLAGSEHMKCTISEPEGVLITKMYFVQDFFQLYLWLLLFSVGHCAVHAALGVQDFSCPQSSQDCQSCWRWTPNPGDSHASLQTQLVSNSKEHSLCLDGNTVVLDHSNVIKKSWDHHGSANDNDNNGYAARR